MHTITHYADLHGSSKMFITLPPPISTKQRVNFTNLFGVIYALMLSVTMLNIVMMSVVMLSVMAPFFVVNSLTSFPSLARVNDLFQ